MTIRIDLTDDEIKLAKLYAKRHSCSLSEAFKNALFEMIEDEYDAATSVEALNEYFADNCKSRPVSELWKECESAE